MLLDKSVGRYVPVRFIAFAFIGGLGVFVHMAVLWLVFRGLGRPSSPVRPPRRWWR
jgi:dolichol-phosphate mannosyltransferase